MNIREQVEDMEERTFTDADAQEMFINIPGPTFDGMVFSNKLAQLQAWLVDNGHDEDAEALEEAMAACQEASGAFHSAVMEVLDTHEIAYSTISGSERVSEPLPPSGGNKYDPAKD